MRGFDGVGSRKLIAGENRRGLSVESTLQVVSLRPEIDASDVLHPNERAVRIRTNDDLTEFLENGLYDPSFVTILQPSVDDLAYSKNRPDLAALGAKDGMMLSGLAIDDNDPLARRDEGLEFLDLTPQASVQLSSSSGNKDEWLITNTSNSVIDTHLLVIVAGLPAGVTVDAKETTTTGKPYYRMFLPDGVLNPGQSISTTVMKMSAWTCW